MTGRIIIADDHPLLRTAVAASVAAVWPTSELIEVASAGAARAEVERAGAEKAPVELLLLDLNMEDSAGLSGLLDFRQAFPALPVVVVSASEEPRVWQAAQRLGASGFIPKSADLSVMRSALEAVQMGDIWFPEPPDTPDDDIEDFDRLASLTPAQRRILSFVARGLLNKQIAHEMAISEATVKAHVTAIFRRLGVINRTQAVLVAKKLEVGAAVPLPGDGL